MSLLLQKEVIIKLLINGTECPIVITQRHLRHPKLEGHLAASWGRKYPKRIKYAESSQTTPDLQGGGPVDTLNFYNYTLIETVMFN